MEYQTYILQSVKDGRFYIGQTQKLGKRLEKHNHGLSSYTKNYMPWNLVWHKQFDSRSEAFKLEQELKKIKSRIGLIK